MITPKLYEAQCYIDKAIRLCEEVGAKATAQELLASRFRINELIKTIELEGRMSDELNESRQ